MRTGTKHEEKGKRTAVRNGILLMVVMLLGTVIVVLNGSALPGKPKLTGVAPVALKALLIVAPCKALPAVPYPKPSHFIVSRGLFRRLVAHFASSGRMSVNPALMATPAAPLTAVQTSAGNKESSQVLVPGPLAGQPAFAVWTPS